jgi:hypothetical protein
MTRLDMHVGRPSFFLLGFVGGQILWVPNVFPSSFQTTLTKFPIGFSGSSQLHHTFIACYAQSWTFIYIYINYRLGRVKEKHLCNPNGECPMFIYIYIHTYKLWVCISSNKQRNIKPSPNKITKELPFRSLYSLLYIYIYESSTLGKTYVINVVLLGHIEDDKKSPPPYLAKKRRKKSRALFKACRAFLLTTWKLWT